MRLGSLCRHIRRPGCRTIVTGSLYETIARGAPIDIHPEVQDALAHKRPVVALETTIVTHGMPQPINLVTAQSVESIVRLNGAVPATIGILEGRVKIGLDSSQLERIADVASNPSVVKVSRRDIGSVLALKKDGGTTCSATLIFAALAGIKVFSTGGLGGVHRGGESSMDVSADLQELSRSSVALVSAGVKSILDIERTLEYLETLGVPVVTYGETADFPAFFTRKSGFLSPWYTQDPFAAATILRTQHQLGMSNGVMFAAPIPKEYEETGQEIQRAVEQALADADAAGVTRRGKEVTPWLLKRVAELTSGKSLPSNVALIENTARVGAHIAVAYAEMDSGVAPPSNYPSLKPTAMYNDTFDTKAPLNDDSSKRLVVIGSSAVDITAQVTREVAFNTHSTVPGAVSMNLGGVARNVAEAAHRRLSTSVPPLTGSAVLVSAVGNDSFGRLLTEESKQIGMRTDGLLSVVDGRTAVCSMMLDSNGGLAGGIADMDIVETLDAESVISAMNKFNPALVAVDGNLSEHTLTAVVRFCNEGAVPVFFEPTSVAKSTRILSSIAASSSDHAPIAFASPNLLELRHMYHTAGESPLDLTQSNSWWTAIDNFNLGSEFRMDLERLSRRDASDSDSSKGTLSFLLDQGIAQMAIHLLPFIQHIVIKCGDLGVVTVFRSPRNESGWANESSNVYARQVVALGQDGGRLVVKHFPALPLAAEEVVNVTGAGDSLVGSVLSTLLQTPQAFGNPTTLSTMIQEAQEAAVSTLKSPLAVSPLLSQERHQKLL